jgi:hypothetical protein
MKTKKSNYWWNLYCGLTDNTILMRDGLCNLVRENSSEKYHEVVSLFRPNIEDIVSLRENFKIAVNRIYWGGDEYGNANMYELTPTRQNILLLMAAMNGEL